MKQLSEFQKALVTSVLEDFSDIPAEEEIDLTFSPEFESRAESLISRTDSRLWRATNTTLKRIILIAAVIAMLAATAMAVPPVREAILDYFLTDRGSTYGITFDPEEAANAPGELLTAYAPAWVPEDFELAIEDVSPAGGAFWYTDPEDEWICFTQYILPTDATDDWFSVNAEETSRYSQLVGEYRVEVIESRSVYFWFWTDNEYLYSLECTYGVDPDTTEQVFHSIHPIDWP